MQPSQNFSIYNGGVEAASNLLSERPHPQNSPHQTELCSELPSSCRCRHGLQRRLHRGQVGAVGGAGPGGFLWTGSRRAVSHDFRWKHLGVLLRLCRLQVPVHAAHNDSNVRRFSSFIFKNNPELQQEKPHNPLLLLGTRLQPGCRWKGTRLCLGQTRLELWFSKPSSRLWWWTAQGSA